MDLFGSPIALLGNTSTPLNELINELFISNVTSNNGANDPLQLPFQQSATNPESLQPPPPGAIPNNPLYGQNRYSSNPYLSNFQYPNSNQMWPQSK